jgi:hypothetical protein
MTEKAKTKITGNAALPKNPGFPGVSAGLRVICCGERYR